MGAIVLEQFSQEQTRAQVDLIECMLTEPSSRILDVPCGSGRISLELTARGYEVTGVEITERFLNNARRQAAQRGFRVAWERRDMRDLSWEDEFDAALNWFGNF